MKAYAGGLKAGRVIIHNNKLFKIVSVAEHQAGKGSRYVEMTLSSFPEDHKVRTRFRTNEDVEIVMLDEVACVYSGRKDASLLFTSKEDNGEILVPETLIGMGHISLNEGADYIINRLNNELISIDLPRPGR